MEIQEITPSIQLLAVNPIHFTDGEIVISLLLITLILIHIFGGIHNAITGIKVKKPQYD